MDQYSGEPGQLMMSKCSIVKNVIFLNTLHRNVGLNSGGPKKPTKQLTAKADNEKFPRE